MFPGLGGMNPAQMQKMMSQLGIKTTEMPVEKAVFYLKDGTTLEMQMPQVVKMTIQGTETYQVVGHALPLDSNSKPKELEITDDDIKMVMQQAGVSKEQAQKALKETKGDIAEAIMSLKK
ncbi:MAG: nascent polypeptide-associated complex protein [Candidatus Diapherotrites archaeon CG08_land_8_20_14_0_20_30_16]|nr:MAG: nascent polypeptide-associated complex protein [Candidatus Diapherotrites archaeon CG08_land_8_20_14_0_20_30_16]